jgi:hypothetical protein
MLRISLVVLLVAGFSRLAYSQEPAELKSGIKFEGELNEKDDVAVQGFPVQAYAREHVVKLKAGQSVALSATVLGVNRLVGVAIFDPAGHPIDATRDPQKAIKSTQLVVEEVNATGEYKVYVGSEKIGAYTLLAKFALPADVEQKQLEDRLRQLKMETADIEARLKTLKEKKK